MVKKGQTKGGKPGGGGGKKPTPAPSGADDSFIVFSNSDKEPKPKRTAASGDGGAGPSGSNGLDVAGDPPKRPDVKKLIGGASWTGKLPVNMLSEHCQKQKWDKPEYTMASGSAINRTKRIANCFQ
jgi:ATP-dependent RNA helicase DHX57